MHILSPIIMNNETLQPPYKSEHKSLSEREYFSINFP